MNRWITRAALAGALAFAAGLAFAGPSQEEGTEPGKKKEAPLPEAKCPVTGNPINFAVSVATDDGPVFFCCKNCIPKYEADPAKYADKVAAQRKALADWPKVQVLCPVSREPVDPKVFIEYEGAKVYFCCKGCIEKFQKDPEKYKAALANSYTYQTKCPVTGNAIDPEARVGKIYFCCKNCPKKFFADPAKYAPNLEAQGFKFDPADLKAGEEGAANTPESHGPHEHGHEEHNHDQ
jgi:YHS domain-containing protein